MLVDLYEFGIKLLSNKRNDEADSSNIVIEESVRKAVARSGDTPRVD